MADVMMDEAPHSVPERTYQLPELAYPRTIGEQVECIELGERCYVFGAGANSSLGYWFLGWADGDVYFLSVDRRIELKIDDQSTDYRVEA